MRRTSMNFMRGMGAGAIAGMAVTAAGMMMLKNKRALGKNAKKAVQAVGDIVDSVQGMFK